MIDSKKNVTYKSCFDLSESGEICSGEIFFSEGILKTTVDSEVVFLRSLENIEELVQRMNIGCGRLELVPKNSGGDASQNILVCSFSMSNANDIAAFVKVINHYLKTDEALDVLTYATDKCPKCGRSFSEGVNTCLFCVDNVSLFRRSIDFVRPYKWSIVIAGILLTISGILSSSVPILNRFLLDNYLSPQPGATPAFGAERGIPIMVITIFLVFALTQVLNIFSQRISNKFSSSLADDLRRSVYDKVQNLSLESMSNKTAGDLIKRVTQDTEVVRGFISEQGRKLIQQVFMFVIIAVVLFVSNPFLTLLVFLPIPFVIFFFYSFNRRIRTRYDKQWRSFAYANSILHDIIKGIRVVKTFGSEEREIEKFSKANRVFAEISISNERFWALVYSPLDFFVGIGEYLILFFGGLMVLRGEMSLGELTQFTMFLAFIYQPLRWLSSLPRRVSETGRSLVKIFEVIDEAQKINDAENPLEPEVSGNIVFDDVSFGYKSYEPVLRNVSIDVKPGEMIGLVGHSGAGKSTIINLIMRLYDPDAGAIRIDGVDLKDMSQKGLRDNIGVVFQETYLFFGSVYDNIAYAKPNAEPAEVLSAAKMANAHEFIIKMPEGYNTVIGENGHMISGGERQRIAIARAVLRNPKILILDEATSSLDPETEDKIQEALGRLIKNRTTVAIAHRLSTLRYADRLVVIEKGKIAESGSHRELLEQKGIYYDLVMAQRQTSKISK